MVFTVSQVSEKLLQMIKDRYVDNELERFSPMPNHLEIGEVKQDCINILKLDRREYNVKPRRAHKIEDSHRPL